MKTLILDNFDSFTYNLFQLVGRLQNGIEPVVYRNDAVSLKEVQELAPDQIIISPGPGNPANHDCLGVCRDVILNMGADTPILGVCLGHLAIIEALGGTIAASPEPRHGKTSPIFHDESGVFEGLPNPLEAMRYHSLIGTREDFPEDLEINAWTEEGLIMGLRHRSWPLQGVQFHPESIGSPLGGSLLSRFLDL